jgi:hypothetical protein
MKSREEIEKLAFKSYGDTLLKASFIHGYTQCAEDMDDEIQSLIDFYKSDVAKLEDVFKDGCSIITLTEIESLKTTIADLEKILNKVD